MESFWKVFCYTYGRRNPLQWTLLVVLPVLLSLFLISLFDARAPLRLPVGVVLQDDSPLAYRIVRNLESNASISVAEFCPDLPTCETAMRKGKLLGTIYLPPELERSATRAEAPAVPVYLNGQSLVAYNTLYKEIRAVLSQEGARLEKRNPPDPIISRLHGIYNPSLDYLAFLGLTMIAAVFHLAAMVVAVYLSGEPLRDRTADTLLALAQGSPLRVSAARLLPALLILWFLYLFFMVWVRHRTHLPLPPAEFALMALAAFTMLAAAMSMGFCWTAITGNMRIASSTAGVVGGPSFAFSGITFPIIAMPAAVQVYAQLLPLTHLLQVQNHLLFASMGHAPAMQRIIILSTMTLFWLIPGILLMARRLTHPHFHGGHREEPFA